MTRRTTVVLDEESLKAMQDLCSELGIGQSEAMRRSLLAYRRQVSGSPRQERLRRRRILEELFELFEGHDPQSEVRRLKEEDEWS